MVRAEGELLTTAGHEVVTHVARNPFGPVRTGAALAMSAWNPLAAQELRKVAQDVRPDIAHVHNTWYALSPSVLSALAAESAIRLRLSDGPDPGSSHRPREPEAVL